jgi:serine/threonine-protein kinase
MRAAHDETVIGSPPRRPAAISSRVGAEEETEIAHVPIRGSAAAAPVPGTEPVGLSRNSGPQGLVGIVLAGRYRIDRVIGEGGMGIVYEALHLGIEKRVAIKVLSPEFCESASQVERFIREAKSASRVTHDNVVEVTDIGQTPDGWVFIAMELLAGEDLGTTLEREGAQPL